MSEGLDIGELEVLKADPTDFQMKLDMVFKLQDTTGKVYNNYNDQSANDPNTIQAVKDLFEAGAKYHKAKFEEVLRNKKLSPYSDEARQLEQEAYKYQIAADHIKGIRTSSDSRDTAISVLKEYSQKALYESNSFLKMQNNQVPRVGLLRRKDKMAQAAVDRLTHATYSQNDAAVSFINKYFHLYPQESIQEPEPEKSNPIQTTQSPQTTS